MITANDNNITVKGDVFEVCAEAGMILYFVQEQQREEFGREAADDVMKNIVTIIEPGSPLRKAAKKSRRNKHD